MGGSDENNPRLGLLRSANLNGGVKVNGNGKVAMGAVGQNGRALSDINRNIVRVQHLPKPSAFNKRGVSELTGICQKKQCVPVHRPITRSTRTTAYVYEMLKFPPSLLATAAVYSAQCSIVGSKQWSKTSKWYSTYSEDQLMEFAKLLVVLHQKVPTSRLAGVYRKYNLPKYGYAVHSEPALFLLDECM